MKMRVACAIILSTGALTADPRTTTFIKTHSPSVDIARELAGSERIISMIGNSNDYFCTICVTPQVLKTFKPERLAQCFIGDSMLECAHTFTVSGSRTSRDKNDWLADYFGLPTDFKSLVSLRPRITQGIINFSCHLGLDPLCQGLYARLYASIAHARFDLNFCELILQSGTNSHDPGYFSSQAIARNNLVSNFSSFASGTGTIHASDITFERLAHAKMNLESNTLTRPAEFTFILGYTPWHDDNYHAGFDLRIAVPAGNTPRGTFLFEAVVGNGHHVELGAGFSSHITFWRCEDSDESASFYFDIAVTHLFPHTQRRSFDLKGSSNSRYQLAASFVPTDNPVGNLRGQIDNTLVTPTAQWSGAYVPVANLTTLDAKISVAAQADLAFALVYAKRSRSWILGYGFWGQSCEKIALKNKSRFDGSTRFALKGDAMMFGFQATAGNPSVPLSATQRNARINGGTNFGTKGAQTPEQIDEGKTNPRIDNPFLAFSDIDGDTVFSPDMSSPGGSDQINTSINPTLLTSDDIDIDSARTAPRVHKLFGQITFFGDDTSCIQPYIGFGAQVEFGRHAHTPSAHKEMHCINCAPTFWSAWIKGGISFEL